MIGLNEVKIKVADFLSIKLIGADIDIWILVHFLSGIFLFIFLGYFIKKSQLKKKLAIFLSILIVWEILELSAIGLGSSFFAKESAVNILYDIGIGFLGGFVTLKFLKK